MLASEALADLELLIRSRYGLIHVATAEEDRTETVLRHLSDRLGLPLFTWSRSKGIVRDTHANGVYETNDPALALAHIVSSQMAALYLFPAFDGMAQNELVVHRLKEVAAALGSRSGALVIAGESVDVHPSVRRLMAVYRLPHPSPQELRALIQHIARDIGRRRPVAIDLTPEDEARLLNVLRGLTLLEAERVLTRAMLEDHRLAADDIAHAVAEKKQIVERDGVLEYYPHEESLAEVADLAGLKAWLRKRSNILKDPERAAQFGLTVPR
ncbi:MAG TPA: hypothetical protein VK928_01900, partial [Longimicrobiales bacterium]|nr:hypothetical protein [Longimicrobiales bacterium]